MSAHGYMHKVFQNAVVVNGRAGVDDAPIADDRAGVDDRPRRNQCAGAEGHVLPDDRGGVDQRRDLFPGGEQHLLHPPANLRIADGYEEIAVIFRKPGAFPHHGIASARFFRVVQKRNAVVAVFSGDICGDSAVAAGAEDHKPLHFATIPFPMNSSIVTDVSEDMPSRLTNAAITLSQMIFRSPRKVMWSTYFTSISNLSCQLTVFLP